jgi:glycosyltransferase involved in cell wall biosynthesis
MTLVLHVTEKLERHGGTPRKLLYLVQHGDAARQRHAFVTFGPGNLDEEMRAAGAPVFCVGSSALSSVTRMVLSVASSARAGVICTHFTRALVCGITAGRLLRLPVIHNAHGPASELPPATFIGRVGRFASRWSYPAATLVTANSRFTAATLQKAFAVPERKLRVIADPVVPRASTHAAPDGIPARRPHGLRLVQIGGLIPVRRQHLLLEGLAAMVRGGIDADLLMAGDGPLRTSLIARSVELGIAERVHWLGFRDDIGDVLAGADIYVSAIDTEGFGIAVVEAMLQGVPVVLANGGAYPELTDNGRHGVLFEPSDAQDMARKTLGLWSDAPRRADLADSARAHAERTYAPRHFIERFVNLVTEACEA